MLLVIDFKQQFFPQSLSVHILCTLSCSWC